jgi:hypothetical protein
MSATSKDEKRSEVDYIPRGAVTTDIFSERMHGKGETLFLHFTVKDTGCGLSSKHKEKLFLRFSQATPKTHVQVNCLLYPWRTPLIVCSTVGVVSASSFLANSRKCKAAVSACSPYMVSDLPFHFTSGPSERQNLLKTKLVASSRRLKTSVHFPRNNYLHRSVGVPTTS